MVSRISYGVATFERDGCGVVLNRESTATNGDEAIRRAKALLSEGETVGAVAFWCLEDSDRDEFSGAVILASIGEVELGALMG